MSLNLIETGIRWLGGLVAYSTLGLLMLGVLRGTQHKAGLSIGPRVSWLRSPLFYLVTSTIFFGAAFVGWVPLPLKVSSSARAWILAIGSLLYFPGMAFVIWGRLALGKNYFVSTGFGAQLFEDQELVTSGPFAIMRHPMYSGLMLASLGSLLIYLTWTTLLFACLCPTIIFRSFREETALAQMFGEQWYEYCRDVPMFFPRFSNRRKNR